MSDTKTRSRFARLAALAEIMLVLVVGNVVGAAIYNVVASVPASGAEGGGVTDGLREGLRILLRIGLIAACGLALLRFRRGVTLREAGLTRAGLSIAHLFRVGFLLGGFSSFLIGLVFAVHAVAPLGEGLAVWDEMRRSSRDIAFYVDLLATSIIVPPLVEEIMARGYMRVRLVEAYGPVGGVVLTGLLFAVAHGKFISTDPLLATFMVVLVISSISWAYIAHVTGSLIPSMVAHAMTNTFATAILFNVWMPFAVIAAVVLWQRQAIAGTIRRFANDWRTDPRISEMWLGVVAVILFITAMMLALSQLGRTIGLLTIGVPVLTVTVIYTVGERRTRYQVTPPDPPSPHSDQA